MAGTVPPKVKVITGANRGIGLELVKSLSRQGDKIIATARNPDTAAELKALPNVIGIVKVDIGDLDSIVQAAEEFVKLAPDGIDELWNNAGSAEVRGSIIDRDSEAFLKMLRINVVGASAITQTLLPLLRKRSTRKIVFVASAMGSHAIAATNISRHLLDLPVPKTEDFFSMNSYNTSKSAMIMEAINWNGALFPDGFVVVPLHPGWVRTDMTLADATYSPEEAIPVMIKMVEDLKPKAAIELLNFDGAVLLW